MEVLHSAPTTSSFTTLSTHQSQTPESFFGGPPVLYHRSPSATLKTHASDLAAAPALSGLAEGAHRHSNGTPAINGNAESDEQYDEEIEVQGVDVWVTSESVSQISSTRSPNTQTNNPNIRRFILYSPTQNTGVSIPYTSISLHAIQSHPPSLFLQLLTSAQTFDDHDPDATISLTITPSHASSTTTEPPAAAEDIQSELQSPTQLLYAAFSACANLHPDPLSGSDNEGDDGQGPAFRFEGDGDIGGVYPLSNGSAEGLPPPMPGSGGWITAENVGDFFDEGGNWRGGEDFTESEVLGVPGAGLGEGAGSVRGREEGEGNGEGLGDETKWRRTG